LTFHRVSPDRDNVNPFDFYPTLKETLRGVPGDIGFLVELKYPAAWFQQATHMLFHERNNYCDAVLKRVFDLIDNATIGNRRCIFISFDPDVAMMMAQKQSRYPVRYFLNSTYPYRLTFPSLGNVFNGLEQAE